jgi:hypothetical protein
MEFLGTAVTLVMAAVLLFAVVVKFSDSAPLAETLDRLGLPAFLARAAAPLVPWAELAVGTAVVFRPDSFAVQTAVLILAGVFAIAGLAAFRLKEPIPCSCFGTGGGGTLGTRQMLAFALWTVGVVILHRAHIATSFEVRAAEFAAVGLIISAARAALVARLWIEGRGDRLSAREMYTWLPSR